MKTKGRDPSQAPSIRLLAVLGLVLCAMACPHTVAWAGTADTVAPGDAEPPWLEKARGAVSAGEDAYFEAEFEMALELLVGSLAVLTERWGEHPIDIDLVEKASVLLILTLHATNRSEEALDVALGLAKMVPPPWDVEGDISPEARDALEDLSDEVAVPEPCTLRVGLPDAACHLVLDRGDMGSVGDQPIALPCGVHWVQAVCEGVEGAHHRVVVEGKTEIDLALPGESGPSVDPGTSEPVVEKPEGDLLLEHETDPRPWYGDPWNLLLQVSGVVLLGVGAGLLGGSLQVESDAYRTMSTRYAGLEDRARSLEISGWVLLGSGAVMLVVGVLRMAAGEDEP